MPGMPAPYPFYMDFINVYAAFAYGLSTSLSLCLASCMPFYLPVLLGFGEDQRKGFILSLGFAAGRFTGYFLMGAIAAALGGAFIGFFNDTFPSASTWVMLGFGLLTMFYGTLILAGSQPRLFGERTCKSYISTTRRLNHPVAATAALGFVSTITPCVPVFTFLLLPFALGRVVETAIITVAFGLGANAAFIVIGVAAGFGVKNIRERFATLRRPLETVSAATLIVFGLFYVLWASGPTVFGWSNASYTLPTVYDFWGFVSYLLRL